MQILGNLQANQSVGPSGKPNQAGITQSGQQKAGASFDQHLENIQAQERMLKKQTTLPKETPDQQGSTKKQAIEDALPTIQEGKEQESLLDPQIAAVLASAMVNPVQVMVDPVQIQPSTDAAIEPMQTLLQQDLSQVNQPILSAKPQAPSIDVGILERSTASVAVETSPLPAAPIEPADTQMVMDDPVAAILSQEADPMARMPLETQIPIFGSWEQEAPALKGDGHLSSLGNADDDTKASMPPPSRVEIGRIATPQAVITQEPVIKVDDKPSELLLSPIDGTRPLQTQPFSLPEQQTLTPVEQIVQETQIQQALDKPEFVMKLKPEALGEVTVRLVMLGDGVSARITTQTEAAKQAIESQLSALTQSMREKGIDVRSVEVLSGTMEHASLMHDGRHARQQAQDQPHAKHAVHSTIEPLQGAQNYENSYATPAIGSSDTGIEYCV